MRAAAEARLSRPKWGEASVVAGLTHSMQGAGEEGGTRTGSERRVRMRNAGTTKGANSIGVAPFQHPASKLISRRLPWYPHSSPAPCIEWIGPAFILPLQSQSYPFRVPRARIDTALPHARAARPAAAVPAPSR